MSRMLPVLLLASLAAAQPAPPGASAWPMDQIILTNGATFRGLILSESATEIRMRTVRRPPGKPTTTLTTRHPAYLDGPQDLHVGLFGANTRSATSKKLLVREFGATVWTREARPGQ